MQNIDKKKLYRTIDANFNRTKEGLRVCEDICRFIFDNKTWTREYKTIRHEVTKIIASLKIIEIVKARDIDEDVGKASTAVEMKRNAVVDIFYANSQRVKESLRVLEEFSKLLNRRFAQRLKAVRYRIYALEKKIIERL